MTNRDEELLSQYLDGELSAAEASGLEQRLAVEPQLQAKLQKMRELNETLKNTFTTARARAVPARIVNLLRKTTRRSSTSAGSVLPFPARQRKSSWAFAIAASIMAASGLLLVQGTGPQLADSTAATDPLLAQALDGTASHADGWNVLADGRQLRPVLTYARIGGGWCREYLLADENGHSRGIACIRDAGTWVTEVLDAQAQQSGSSDEYRTAGASDSDQIAIFMGNNAADIALSAEQELEQIATGWK